MQFGDNYNKAKHFSRPQDDEDDPPSLSRSSYNGIHSSVGFKQSASTYDKPS
jgi:hypothetical protein